MSVDSLDSSWLGQSIISQFSLNLFTATGLELVNNKIVINKITYIINNEQIDFNVDYLVFNPVPSTVKFAYTINK